MITEKESRNTPGTLINRNVVIDTHRTSVRLEAEMWGDLRDICRREGKSVHEICTLISERKDASRSLTSAIRVFLTAYYRSAATEDGHYRAGHGRDYNFLQRNTGHADLIGHAYTSEDTAMLRQARGGYNYRTG